MTSLRNWIPALALALGLGFGFGRATAQDPDTTPLQEAMGELQAGAKALRPLLEKPAEERQVMLETVHRMQAAALRAIQNPPGLPEGFPEEGGFVWTIGFQRKVLTLADALFELELGIHRGRASEVQAAYEKLGTIKGEGHDAYK